MALAVAEVALVGIAVVAVFSTLGYVLAFWSFRLSRTDSGTLHLSRGLLTTRATTIEERRLRGVELSEPLLLRAGTRRAVHRHHHRAAGRPGRRAGRLAAAARRPRTPRPSGWRARSSATRRPSRRP